MRRERRFDPGTVSGQFVRIIREHARLSVEILLKIVTLMSRRLRLTSGRLVDYLQD